MRSARRPIYIASASVLAVAVIAFLGTAYFLGIFDPHPRLALDTFNRAYSTEGSRLDTCDTCHTGRTRTNGFGSDLKTAVEGMTRSTQGEVSESEAREQLQVMLKSIEELDSDGDRYSNIDEITARTFPGNPADHPTASP